MVVVETVDRLDQGQALFRVSRQRDGDGSVELDDRRRRHSSELVVERGDRGPVGLLGLERVCMDGRDRCLQLVGAGPTETNGSLQDAAALFDAGRAPERPVLILEQDELSLGAGTGFSP